MKSVRCSLSQPFGKEIELIAYKYGILMVCECSINSMCTIYTPYRQLTQFCSQREALVVNICHKLIHLKVIENILVLNIQYVQDKDT